MRKGVNSRGVRTRKKSSFLGIYGILTCVNLLLRIWLSYSKRDEFIRTVGLKANEDSKKLDKTAKSE